MTPEQLAAVRELQQKSLSKIQCETAIKWAYRSWAATQLGLSNDATEYRHEALEHAALCDDDTMIDKVRWIIAGGT